MGHQRTGDLPKTRKWQEIISAIGKLSQLDPESIQNIAGKTLEASSQGLRKIPKEPAVQHCFQFLIALSIAGRDPDFANSTSKLGIDLARDFTKLNLSRALRIWLSKSNKQDINREFATLARYATTDTIADWINKNTSRVQLNLFVNEDKTFSPWRAASDGRGFCELSRTFFSNFTTRYIHYFLSRTASSSIKNLSIREEFSRSIKLHLDQIAHHAFETSRIIQSFSAGWFNKNTKLGIPSDKKIERFIEFSFAKIREELKRERRRND